MPNSHFLFRFPSVRRKKKKDAASAATSSSSKLYNYLSIDKNPKCYLKALHHAEPADFIIILM